MDRLPLRPKKKPRSMDMSFPGHVSVKQPTAGSIPGSRKPLTPKPNVLKPGIKKRPVTPRDKPVDMGSRNKPRVPRKNPIASGKPRTPHALRENSGASTVIAAKRVAAKLRKQFK